MTTALQFCELLRGYGFDYFASVPCSIFKSLVTQLDQDENVTYIPAVREDTAVGMAAGAYMAGRRSMVLLQNSGLGVCLNTLGSLAMIYKLPLLLLISWRGYQGNDAPEHLVMGKAMLDILSDVGLPYEVIERDNPLAALDRAEATMNETGLPFALILRKGILE